MSQRTNEENHVDLHNILLQCHTYRDPPLNQNSDPYTAYSENFLKSHVIPELLKETKQLDIKKCLSYQNA